MLRRLPFALLLGLGLNPLPAIAAPSHSSPHVAARQEAAPPPPAAPLVKLLIGGGPSGTIAAADFDGTTFKMVANNTMPGTSASWLLFRPGSTNLYAVDENSESTRLFDFNPASNEISLLQNATGSSGVVSLEFSGDLSTIVGAAFGQGRLDIWDTSPDTAPEGAGRLSLRRQIVSNDALGPNTARQEAPHPHQVVLDPTRRFFVAPDLGTDTLLVIDSADEAFAVTNRVRVQPPGCGPRHGAFYPRNLGGDPATHYIVLCEMLSLVQVFEVAYAPDSLRFTPIQTLSTFGPDTPPANLSSSTAGELQLSADGRDLYVSNRNTGNDTDSLSHFSIRLGGAADNAEDPAADAAAGAPGTLSLAFRQSVSAGGKVPRMFSLSAGDERFVFVANQDGELGLVAMRRNEEDGSLDPTPVASMPLSTFGGPMMGPQFVQQI